MPISGLFTSVTQGLTSGWDTSAVCVSGSFGLGTDSITHIRLRQVFSLTVSCLPDLGGKLNVSRETACLDDRDVVSFEM